MLLVSDNMISYMEFNTNLSPIVTTLSMRGRKLNNLLVFISQSYLKVPKNIRLTQKTTPINSIESLV